MTVTRAGFRTPLKVPPPAAVIRKCLLVAACVSRRANLVLVQAAPAKRRLGSPNSLPSSPPSSVHTMPRSVLTTVAICVFRLAWDCLVAVNR
jgi:hypothetical protein